MRRESIPRSVDACSMLAAPLSAVANSTAWPTLRQKKRGPGRPGAPFRTRVSATLHSKLASRVRLVVASGCSNRSIGPGRRVVLGKEIVHATLGLFPRDPVTLLNLAHQLLGPAVDQGQIIISEFAPLLFNGAF